MSEHTPTPWEVVAATEHHGPYIVGPFGGDVADLYAMSNPLAPSMLTGGDSYPVLFGGTEANVAFIVRAVNAFDDMFEALSACASILPRYHMKGNTVGDDEELDAVLERANDALALAKATSP